jgi:hypothetical protein
VDAHLLKLHCLQNRVLCAIGNLDRGTLVGELHVAFKIPYVYDYITKLCRIQAEIIPNHVHQNVRGTEQRESRHSKYKRLKPGGGQAYDRSADELQFQSSYISSGIICYTSLHYRKPLHILYKCHLAYCSDKGCTESTVTWKP